MNDINYGCQSNALINAEKELIAIKEVNTTKNFNAGAIITTPKKQFLALKHIIQHIHVDDEDHSTLFCSHAKTPMLYNAF